VASQSARGVGGRAHAAAGDGPGRAQEAAKKEKAARLERRGDAGAEETSGGAPEDCATPGQRN